jgi:hypothetical protein
MLFPTIAVAGIAGALTVAAGSPVSDAADPPISVAACDFTTYDVPPIPATPLINHGNLRITFTNRTPLTATDVRFAIRYQSSTEVVEDTGKFSTGTPITQDFEPSTEPGYHGPAYCSVESATFSDGSKWQAR